MYKFKAIAKILTIIVVGGILLFSSLAIFSNVIKAPPRTFQEVFYDEWGVKLPADMETRFNKREKDFRGEGIRYAVFACRKSEFFDDFVCERNEQLEGEIMEYIDEADFTIPPEFVPDWSEEYCFKRYCGYEVGDWGRGSYYMIYLPQSSELIICQNLI